MTDEEVIETFLGEYTSDGQNSNTDPDKADYFPRRGVILTLEKRGSEDATFYVKILFSGEPFGAAATLSETAFVVEGEKLVGHNIEVRPGLLMTETLEMMENDKMLHSLEFSDGISGTWICEP